MSGFHVRPEALDAHAGAVESIGSTAAQGAAAEVTGTGQADFGVLIGHTLGYGIRGLSSHFSEALTATSKALDATADQLRNSADGYRGAEETNTHGVRATEGGAQA